ncbi:hypothetical protein [Rhodoferax aquaticus]|uniref:Uncharacterized protein n=1 Tax=Rhodoferax aquaticus TaxID=2527691 RepID=A0A515EUP3_9BURK|nr:hypothetical protein [Rhodoferax aquaticus]QDL56405.1 hypothetical protein EXZ61_20845 [Rhodoferax aquaticus]
MTTNWVFPQTSPFQVQGRDLSEDNFAQEERSNLEILIREALQNPLDARSLDNTGPVKVCVNVLKPGEFDVGYLSDLMSKEFRERLLASDADPLPPISVASVLVIEDFGTTGLEGQWKNPNADGPGENWNAFWFREGEGAKSATGSNGRAGQGKITYYRVGAARSVFGMTIRKSDGKTLLMGRSAFRRVYPYNDSKYSRHSFWGTGIEQPLPVVNSNEITRFSNAFHLTRKLEPGLSLVIPFPIDFDIGNALTTVITEFYYPIAKGNLEVTLNGESIGADNVEEIAMRVLPDKAAKEKKSSFSQGFRALVRAVIEDEKLGVDLPQLKPGWDKTPSLKDDAFEEGVLTKLRARMETGERISVRCPVSVRPKKGEVIQTSFDVHLEVPEDLDRTEEAYVRRDLLIGSESHLVGSSYLQKSRGLTLVLNNDLSAFLADAEEPTHLKWNGSRPRLAEVYSNPQATLRAVRNAAPRILALVSNGVVKRDIRALARHFSKPAEDGKPKSPGGPKHGDRNPSDTPPTEVSVRKPFKIHTGPDFVIVKSNGTAAPHVSDLPIECSLELAYEGLDQDPFKAYDPFDFDLADTKAHKIESAGITLIDRKENRIRFSIVDPEFALEVPGFDANIRLRARLNYTEKTNGTTISAE